MGRIIMGIIAIGIVGYLGYRSMYGSVGVSAQGVSAPRQRLDNVQKAADRIEDQQQKAADEALKKSAE